MKGLRQIRTDVLGVGFDNITMTEALDKALELMNEKRSAYTVTPNPEIVMACFETPELASAVENADMVLADGIGVIYGAKLLGTPLKQKIPGIDFASALFPIMAQRGMKLYLLGAKPGVAEEAGRRISLMFPGLNIVGTGDGYFTQSEPVIEKINAAEPDLLLVCLGSPKQELWMAENASNLKVGLMAGLGGALDVYAGVVRRAPKAWQNLGLEWLYRLLKDPSRAGRMKSLPRFALAVAARRFGNK